MKLYLLLITTFIFSSCTSSKTEHLFNTQYNIEVQDANDILYLIKRLNSFTAETGIKTSSEVRDKLLSVNFIDLIEKKSIENLFDLNGELKIKGESGFLDMNDVDVKLQKSIMFKNFEVRYAFKDKKKVEIFSTNNLAKYISLFIGDSLISKARISHIIDNGIFVQSFGRNAKCRPMVFVPIIKNPYDKKISTTYSQYKLEIDNMPISSITLDRYDEIKKFRKLMIKLNNYKDKHRRMQDYPTELSQVSRFLNETSFKNFPTFVKTSPFDSVGELEKFIEKLHFELKKYEDIIFASIKNKDLSELNKPGKRTALMISSAKELFKIVKIYNEELK